MSKYKFLLLFLLITNFNMSQQVNEVTRLPKLNSERKHIFDIKHVKIELSFNFLGKKAEGTASLTISAVNPIEHLTLDAGYLTINSITLNDGKELKFEYDGSDKDDGLRIYLEKLFQPGEEFTIKINYKTNYVNETDPDNLWGSYGKGLKFFSPTSNDPLRPLEMWSSAEPYGNRYWYPCFDAPNELRTTEFIATVDKKLTVVSNGELISEIENSDGTKTYHWKADVPYANHLTAFVISEYINVKQKFGSVSINNFGYRKEKDWIESSVERLPDMMRFYSEYTGIDYPYSSYSQAFVQELPGGMDNMMFSTITENMIDDKPTHADYFYLWDAQEAQMLASQWFGSYVTPVSYEHAWLNESFARYFDELYAEHKNGFDEFQLWYRNFDLNTYFWDWNNNVKRPIVTPNYDDPETMIRDNYSFSRGALVLHMLRNQLGEEKWRKAINLYLKTNANKLVTTQDFQNSVNISAGESMDWFFDQWVYNMGHPVFDVTDEFDNVNNKLVLTVKQIQKTDFNNEYPQSLYFKGDMDIKIDKKIYKVNINPEETNTFTFELANKPMLIAFDHNNNWIKEIKFKRSFDELIYQLKNDDDVLGRIWAMNKLVNIAKDTGTLNEDKAKIIETFRSVVLSNSYWRMRLNVLTQLQGLIAPSWETKPFDLDNETREMLLNVIEKDSSWLRAFALSFLGMTRDKQYSEIYIKYLSDNSFRVINSAAASLGKTKSEDAFNELLKLLNKPSMKSQSLMCVMSGLKELGDQRGYRIALEALSELKLPRWRLPTPPVWDYRIIAAQLIAQLGKSDEVYPMIFENLNQSINQNEISDIFNNILLIIELKVPKGQEAFEILKEKYKNNSRIYNAVINHETTFKNALNGN